MQLSECRGQACLNYAEHEHLRRSQLGVAMLGCKNRKIKKWKNYLSWQLTTTANLPPYHYEPTTLLLSYHYEHKEH